MEVFPDPIGFVTDFENMYTANEEWFLDSIIRVFENKTTIQIAVVTIDTNMTSYSSFDSFTLKLANKWGVGQREKNNGILIGISHGYGRIQIQNGYGIEQMLSDEQTKMIIETYFVPEFRKGSYFNGVVRGLEALMKELQ